MLFVVAGLLVRHVTCQTVLNELILGTFIFSMYGDRTPSILPIEQTLTPLGATQMYNVGAAFRDRYISNSNGSNTLGTAILGISPDILDNEEISILTTADQFTIASATAFMQGLYPPLDLLSSDDSATDLSMLANGSDAQAPLSNYQYPQLYVSVSCFSSMQFPGVVLSARPCIRISPMSSCGAGKDLLRVYTCFLGSPFLTHPCPL